MKPWTVLSSKRVVDDPPWVILRRDEVERDDLRRHQWVLEQPTWVNVVAVTDDEQLVLVRQHRHGIGLDSLEIPGGYGESDDPLADARRELKEETGYGDGEWTLLQRLAPNPALQDNWMYTFLASGVRVVGPPEPDTSEDLEVALHPPSDIPGLIADGQIIHALHVSALLQYLVRQR